MSKDWSYKSAPNLLPHQKQLLKGIGQNVAFFVDMGLGKTYLGSEAMRHYAKPVNLIVCQKSKIADWVAHMRQHYYVKVFDLTDPKQFESFFYCKSYKVGVINYELAFRRERLLELEDICLCLDESSLIQNDLAKRSKLVLKLDRAHVILLSGTVVNGCYEKLWSQAQLLGWYIKKSEFWDQYVITRRINLGGFYKHIPTGTYKNVRHLKNELAHYGARFLKTEEVLELPEQTVSIVYVKANAEVKTFQKTNVLTLSADELMVGDMALTKRLYERILCGSFNKYKLDAVKDLLNSSKDRFVIFYAFDRDLHALKELMTKLKRPVSIVNGKQRDLAAFDAQDNAVALIQWQAGAMGLNLQAANKMILFTLPDGWSEGYEQGLKRIHRIGQTQACFYWVLITQDSIEQEIYERLQRKKKVTDRLFS